MATTSTTTSTIDPAARIVIVGAGVVGAALADELILRGASDVTLIDQGPLYNTGGSSSHAPGFVFQTNASRVMCTLAQRTLDKLDGLELDGAPLLDRVGGLEIATTATQYAELERRLGFARAWGVPAELVGPEQVAALWPGLDTDLIIGALHTPTDGAVHAPRAVEFQARRAAAGGATVLGLTRVTEVLTDEGKVTGVIVEDTGDYGDAREAPRTLPADIVVTCGGIWGHPLATAGGLRVPMHPMEHGFAWTTPVPELPGTRADGSPLRPEEPSRPIVRHQAAGMYFREFGNRIGIGAYEHRPIPLDPADLTDTAHMLATGEHPAKRTFTPDDFAATMEELGRVLPAVKDLELTDEFNGVFSFTPDGGPMLGPSPHVDGFWCAQAVWVTQSAGVAQVMADWMLTGDPGIDTHELDHTRFDPALLSNGWIRGRAAENYDEVYDVHFPHQSTAVTRGLKTSPFHTRMEQAGAVFAEHNGWERPLWHDSNLALFEDPAFLDGTAEVPVTIPKKDAWGRVNWSPVAAAEAWATRNRAAVYDMTSLTRVLVRGPGATAFLERQCTNLIDKPVGRTLPVVYSLMLDESGGILSDVTVTRLGDEEYMLGVNGALDVSRLTRAAQGTGVTVDDITTSTCCLGLWGPRARDILTPLAEDDISHEGLKYFRAQTMFIAGVPVLIQRVSYVGDLGWEIYTPAAHGLHLWDAVMRAGAPHGLVPAGRLAFNSLRTEKGYISWGADVTRENTPDDAGLGFAVRTDPAVKPTSFIGKEALLANPTRGRRLVTVTARSDAGVPEAGSPVWVAGTAGTADPVGYVTGADAGYVTGLTVGTAWVPTEHSAPGTALQIGRFNRLISATVVTGPVDDPAGLRIRR
ncbi:GcvT family protein [Corynebacterium terpenotabidum]|uniref:Dimethylglycine oxidase n=1 Tax=Corynebacterium terpenotabidum Y-11 TaxID=1200352 RepID=S4XFC5_9CORY|nr:FAD-dependent oxidoreductase [Corynebacterium terpenotabidum]AGP31279.1 hypothetical protein A606_08170 [Corynebacterium terpenotabidum Y-11]